jgi:hypothetical protein
VRRFDVRVDVSGTTDVTGELSTAALICSPDPDVLPPRPVVAFCWPGGGYSRGYYDIRFPGFDGYSQAEHHTARGVIVVACDHLGVGDSSEPDRSELSYENVAAVNRATVDGVLGLLAAGALDDDFPVVRHPVLIGMGQSYGGMLLIVQQGRQWTFDAIAMLGYTAIGLSLPAPPAGGTSSTGGKVPPPDQMSEREKMAYFFHWEDVPAEIVAEDMKGEHPTRELPLPMWASDRRPGGRHWSPAPPGVIAHWANVIECPVFIGLGERDVSPDPWAEPCQFRRTKDITLYIGPRMGHMHNFAGTRALLWDRLCSWMAWVADSSADPARALRPGRPRQAA